MHEAARLGDTLAITRLLAAGGDVNAKDRLKRTPIHLAAWAGQADTVDYLVGCGALVRVEAADGMTRALPLPPQPSSIRQRLLRAQRAAVAVICDRSESPSAPSHPEVGAAFVANPKTSCVYVFVWGAGLRASTSRVRPPAPLSRGVRGARVGRAALHFSAMKGQVGASKALLRAGANVAAMSSKGMTPLHLAVQSGAPH